ncbi:lysine decarboxylase [Niallia sp. NCCP-28]|nr:aminotransferase class I/II-fold pyridoxal phosphate-dependent enzyme [Niallia sp. NCCP-28]GKU85043.1 lysine decarboxylase [Niallia sp. NCCP-28]
MQTNTPLYTRLSKFQERKNISFHVPGHKNGLLLSLKEWKENLLSYDLTELTELDDLHAPTDIILHAEELLAELYGAKRSYFLVNGSTVGNLAMILGTAYEGQQVFVQRNSHKSIMNAIKLSKVKPILLNPQYDMEWEVPSTISVDMLKRAIKLYPDVKVLILTSPNYYGMVGELAKLIQLAHHNKIVVLVDEAHGAHFIGSNYFPISAVEAGADVVVQSAHKTLPALTMGSYLHFNSNLIEKERIEGYLSMLQSSSPSYPIMASLDIARSYIATFNRKDEEYLRMQIFEFRKELNKIKQIKVLEYKEGAGDPLKITIQSTCSLSGFSLQKMLERQGIYTELADAKNLLFVFPLLKSGMYYPIEEAIKRIKRVFEKLPNDNHVLEDKGVSINIDTNIVELKLSEGEQSLRKKKYVLFDEAENGISAETVIPYPPGIPLLIPGEEITSNHIEQLKKLVQVGANFQGDSSVYKRMLAIYTDKESRRS